MRDTILMCGISHFPVHMNYSIPIEVTRVLHTLEEAGFDAYIVGGCVRDLLLGRPPADWDITTNAKPEDIQRLFPDHVYENTFGTVGVKTGSDDETLAIVEVTPYRTEQGYSDRRRPDVVEFVDSLEKDLARRDFTINAMAMCRVNGTLELVDPFGGSKDLQKKLIQTVGDPQARFSEDALRLMRAVRFATQLDFAIASDTANAIHKYSELLKDIAHERIRHEFDLIIMSDRPEVGVQQLETLDLMHHIMPELREGINVGQNLHHIYTVWEHNVRALKYAAEQGWSLEVRLAALLHDVGKPRTKKGEGMYSTFYNHDMVGAQMTKPLLERMKYPKSVVEKVTKLVRFHLFYYNVDEVTPASVRRLIAQVGVEDMEDLIRVRMCDRIGSGVPKAEPYKLRHFRFMVEQLQRDPISVKMLKVTGNDLMKELSLSPGPRIGYILNALLGAVLDEPKHNTKEYLMELAVSLNKLDDDALKNKSAEAKSTSAAVEGEEVEKIKKRHKVK